MIREQPDKADPVTAMHAPAPALQLLVVDDNRDAADAMVMAAQVLGHEAVAVYDGGAALELLQSYRPDLMILDLSMPGMDGYALASAIRGLPAFDATPLVALSGFGADADRQRALQSGFDLHTLKPMEIDTLEQLLLSVQRTPGRAAARESLPRSG